MTKFYYDNSELINKLPNILEDTTAELDKIINLNNSRTVPKGFTSSKYNDSIAAIKKISRGLKNVRRDIINANKNFEEAELNCKNRHSSFNSDFRIDLDNPIIR